MDYDKFTREWLKRAERVNEPVDDADRFISLWIAFNSWLKENYGERVYDKGLIEKAKTNQNLKDIFQQLSIIDCNFQTNLNQLQKYHVVDMRNSSTKQNKPSCKGDYEIFLDKIYLIRCNLFHGRKNVDEDKKDRELVDLALKLLHPLFKKVISNRIGSI
jgi:hypothetical protein